MKPTRRVRSAAQPETIDVIELPHLDAADDAASIAKLAEIAENLHRREITALERDELLAAWVKLCEERKKAKAAEKVGQHGPLKDPGSGRGATGGIREAARQIGVPRKSLERSMKVAALAPEAKEAARKHGLADNQAALLEAAKAKTPKAQTAIIERRARRLSPEAAARRRRWPAARSNFLWVVVRHVRD